MAIVNESRPVAGVEIQLGGSYAQPGGSPEASWMGQTTQQMGWAGERNAGQPLYAAFDANRNQAEFEARLRAMDGETFDNWKREHQSKLTAMGASDDQVATLVLQLYSLNYG